jgi:hypothetical protein
MPLIELDQHDRFLIESAIRAAIVTRVKSVAGNANTYDRWRRVRNPDAWKKVMSYTDPSTNRKAKRVIMVIFAGYDDSSTREVCAQMSLNYRLQCYESFDDAADSNTSFLKNLFSIADAFAADRNLGFRQARHRMLQMPDEPPVVVDELGPDMLAHRADLTLNVEVHGYVPR